MHVKRILLIIAALLTVLVSFLHLSFWKIGNWGIELKKLSADNQGIVQVLNIGSIFFLLFSGFITYTIAQKETLEKTDALFLMLVAGYYLIRIAVGFPFFGFSIGEVIVQAFCLIAACCYLIPVKLKKM
jgi:hypothetical protein